MKTRRNPKNNTLTITVDREELRLLTGSIHQNILDHIAHVGAGSASLPALRAALATLEGAQRNF